jgi:hypothetical protein
MIVESNKAIYFRPSGALGLNKFGANTTNIDAALQLIY